MRRKPKLVLPLLLLASTTLAIGSIVYGLLWKETNRLRESALATAQEQASTVVENIGLTVAEIKTALMQSLLNFDGPNFDPQLETWQSQDPLVNFAFAWRSDRPTTVITFPTEPELASELIAILKPPASKREQSDWLWDLPAASAKDEAERSDDDAIGASILDSKSNYAQSTSIRQAIRSQSQEANRLAKSSAPKKVQRWSSDSTEWIHQERNGTTYWIGISRWNGGEAITGAAIKLDELGPILGKSFPAQFASNISQFEISDARGLSMAQASPLQSYVPSYRSTQSGYSRAFPIGPELPGWTLTMRTNLTGSVASILSSSAGISTTLVLLALFATGLWLVWQSRASQIDAAQKVTFVSNVSHELKTPLTTIRMYSELLQSGRVSLEEKRATYLHTISSEAQRLTRLVNNVLDFSRLERGKAKLACQSQALAPIVEDYLEMRGDDLRRAAFALELQIDAPDLHASFDPDALRQILGNLIDNSLKYAKDGHWLRIRISDARKQATIDVSDKGPGLPSKLHAANFKAFQRGDDSLVAESSGFGLGLSISQTLAEEMGGTLRYLRPKGDSETPTFRLTLQS